jgi:hypothetical protein
MEELNNAKENTEKFVDKSVHQAYNDTKPVGYGSSIQNSGNGNKTRPRKPEEDLVDQQKKKDE